MNFRLIAFIFLSLINFGYGQEVFIPQKEYMLLEEKGRSGLGISADTALFYADLIQNSKNPLHRSFSAGLKAYVFELKLDRSKSDDYYKKAFDLLEKELRSREKLRVKSLLLNYAGLIAWKRKELGRAAEKFQEGTEFSELIGDQVQVVKFLNNQSKVYMEAGKYSMAITISRKSDSLSSAISTEYSPNQFKNAKSSVYFNLGMSYEELLKKEESSIISGVHYADSAIHYYQKCIFFSDLSPVNKVCAQLNMANIYWLEGSLEKAKDVYLGLMQYCKENNYIEQVQTASYNIGLLLYELKDYKEAYGFFKEVETIYEDYGGMGQVSYVYSCFFLAMIYDRSGEVENAQQYFDRYSECAETLFQEETNGIQELNGFITQEEINKSIEAFESRLRRQSMMNWGLGSIGVIAVLALLYFLVRNIRDKRKAHLKMEKLIQEIRDGNQTLEEEEASVPRFEINNEKEEEIINQLEKMVAKQQYLKTDFSLAYVAKKIRTNTTYLSRVVNKHYGKSFREFSNELKINYAMHQLISNTTYRKYSTQAIAESVGFKNATSFTRSFKKRTGMTPVQFIKKIDGTQN